MNNEASEIALTNPQFCNVAFSLRYQALGACFKPIQWLLQPTHMTRGLRTYKGDC